MGCQQHWARDGVSALQLCSSGLNHIQGSKVTSKRTKEEKKIDHKSQPLFLQRGPAQTIIQLSVWLVNHQKEHRPAHLHVQELTSSCLPLSWLSPFFNFSSIPDIPWRCRSGWGLLWAQSKSLTPSCVVWGLHTLTHAPSVLDGHIRSRASALDYMSTEFTPMCWPNSYLTISLSLLQLSTPWSFIGMQCFSASSPRLPLRLHVIGWGWLGISMPPLTTDSSLQ